MVLGRTSKQYWHLMRTMMTQLVENERIKTTLAKAKHLHPFAESIVKHAKKATINNNSYSKTFLNRVLRTDKARKKVILQLAERFKGVNCHYTKVSRRIYNRRGDNAPMVTIEYRNNQLQPYPKIFQADQKFAFKSYKKQLLTQRKEKFQQKLNTDLTAEMRQFFEKKINELDFELQIERKRKTSAPIYTYYN